MKWCLLVAPLLLGCAQSAGPTATAPDASVAASAPAASQSSGSAADAAPPPAMKRLRHALSRSAKNLRFERRDGRLHIDLGGTFQTATVVTVDPTGQPRRVCVDDASELDSMIGEAP